MVMPLWDENPLTLPRLPFVTWTLIAANTLMFIGEAIASPGSQASFEALALTPECDTRQLHVTARQFPASVRQHDLPRHLR
jgi:hypothetical protein